MAKHTQTIRRLLPTTCLSVFDQFVELALKGLNELTKYRNFLWNLKKKYIFLMISELIHLNSLNIRSEILRLCLSFAEIYRFMMHLLCFYYQDVCGALRDLVPFVQFKKLEKHSWRNVTLSKVVVKSLDFYLIAQCISYGFTEA